MGNGISTANNSQANGVPDFDAIMSHLCKDTEREIKFYRQIASEYKTLINEAR